MKLKLYKKEQIDYFPVYPCTIDLYHPQEKIIRTDGHIYHHIFIVSDGSGIVTCNGEKCIVNKGDMF